MCQIDPPEAASPEQPDYPISTDLLGIAGREREGLVRDQRWRCQGLVGFFILIHDLNRNWAPERLILGGRPGMGLEDPCRVIQSFPEYGADLLLEPGEPGLVFGRVRSSPGFAGQVQLHAEQVSEQLRPNQMRIRGQGVFEPWLL